MPAQWTGEVVGKIHNNRLTAKELAEELGWNDKYYVKGADQPTTNNVARQSCLTLGDMHEYLQAAKGYGWHISNLKIYDDPKQLSEFKGLRKTKFGYG